LKSSGSGSSSNEQTKNADESSFGFVAELDIMAIGLSAALFATCLVGAII